MKKLVLVLLIMLITVMGIMAKTEVTFFTHPSISGAGLEPGEYEQRVIDQYEALNPDVDIILEVVPYLGGGAEKVYMMIASGNAPDIYARDIPRIKGYAALGLLADWDDVLDKSDFPDYAVEASSYEGKMYYLPIGLRANSFVISRTLAKY